MKLHNHVIIEPHRGKIVWHPRWFFHLYRGPEYGDGKLLDGHLEFVLSKPTAEFGLNFEVGTAGSETPFDGYLKIAGTTVYWGIEQGNRLADLVTQIWFNRLPNRLARACLNNTCDCPPYHLGNGSSKRHHGRNGQPYEHRYDGRALKINTHDSRLWLSIWTRTNGWKRGEFAEWRSKSIRLNPLDALLGDRRYWYEAVETRPITVAMPEAEYPVKATLQRQIFGRPKGRKTASWTVDVKADECKGIPTHYDRSGGWKGDRTWGFGVALKQGNRHDWQIDAKAAIEAWVLKSRADSGFREPQPLDAT